jgi:hypothetical protein
MPKLLVPVLGALSLLFVASGANAKEPARKPPALTTYRTKVVGATVMLPERGCAGSIVRSSREILTAGHCIPEDAESVDVKLPDGTETVARVAYLDRDIDLALLELPSPAAVTPLPIADELPRRGSSLLFIGRIDRRSRSQIVKVEKLDRCPSLPLLPNAVFTSLDAKPGDSGAPLIDAKGRVAAIVHGGARCEIAVPTASLSGVKIDRSSAPVPRAAVKDSAKDDSWFFDKTDRGFKFHWSFHWSSV